MAALVGAVGAAIAVRWRSQFVAALALLGALASPVLVGGETSGLALAFMVVALVATVAVLVWQRWGWLALGAFLISAPQLAFWAWDRDDLAAPASRARAVLVPLRRRRDRLRAAGPDLEAARVLRVGPAAERGSRSGLGWGLDRRPGLLRRSDRCGSSVSRSPTSRSGLRLPPAHEHRDRRAARRDRRRALRSDARSRARRPCACRRLVRGGGHPRLGRRHGPASGGRSSSPFAFLGLAALHTLVDEAPPDALVDGVDDLAAGSRRGSLRRRSPRSLMRHFVELVDLRLVLLGVGSVALVYAASLTIVDVLQGDASEPSQTAQVALSTFWGVVGLGRDRRRARPRRPRAPVRRSRPARTRGREGLRATTSPSSTQLYRVLSFIAVGIVLLVGAYAYQRVRTAGRHT